MSHVNTAAPGLEAVQIHGLTRSSFILRGAVAAGSVYGATMVSPFVRQAFAQGGGDVEILNFALTLEYLEAAFYKESAKISGLSDQAVALVQDFGNAEQQHVDALTNTIMQLGGKPVKAPGVDFGSLSNEAAFLKLAVAFEDVGVSAYNGAAPAIKSTEVLAAAGSIVQVEARHAAAVRLLSKQDPAPNAFDETLNTNQVLKAVKPYVRA
jgi:rubrerythrin